MERYAYDDAEYYFKQRKYLFTARAGGNRTALGKALKYADSMMLWVVKNNAQKTYFEEYAQSYLSKGDVLMQMKRYAECYENYYQGKLIFTGKENKVRFIGYNFRLADVCYLSGKYRQAATFYLEACKEKINEQDNFEAANNNVQYLDNAGLSYMKAGMTDSAIFLL